MNTIRHLIIGVSLFILAFGCSDQTDSGSADIQFRLTDMPGDYQQVNIDLEAVLVKVNDSTIELSTNQGIYNLLEFVNGKDTLVVEDEVPSGMISQIRLILGDNNTIMVDSVVYDLKTPSAQQSGLKLNVHNEFQAGEAYTYIIDFVVEKSIVAKGNGQYSLKPVIRVFTEDLTGSIQGVVDPSEARPLVRAFNDTDTASTFADSMSGAYMIRGLYEGQYSLDFLSEEGFKDTSLAEIDVVPGQMIILDTLWLN